MNTQLTMKVTDATKQRFTETFEALKAAGKVFTQAEAMEYILNAYHNPPTVKVSEDTPETLHKLAELQAKSAAVEQSNAELQNLLADNNAQANNELTRLNQEIAALTDENNQLKEYLQNAQGVHEQLNTQLAETNKKIQALQLQPFTARLLELTAERLSKKYGKNITPIEVLSDMFLKYTIQQYSQWFYPFVLSDREIISVAANINPAITTIKQVKDYMNIR